MEEDCADVVKMAIEGEQTSSCLVVPDLDLVVIAARNEQRLCLVEVDSSNWAVVLFKSVDQGSHAIVPQPVHTVSSINGARGGYSLDSTTV